MAVPAETTVPSEAGALAVPADVSGARMLASARDKAHGILVAYCGECHQSSSPGAKDGALAVFDLDHGEWYRGFTEERLQSARGRIDGQASPPHKLAFARFVELEAGHRADRTEPSAGNRPLPVQ